MIKAPKRQEVSKPRQPREREIILPSGLPSVMPEVEKWLLETELIGAMIMRALKGGAANE